MCRLTETRALSAQGEKRALVGNLTMPSRGQMTEAPAAVAPLPVAAHPEPAASRVSDVEWLHQIRVVLLLRYFDRRGPRAIVRRVGFPRHRVHAQAVVVRSR